MKNEWEELQLKDLYEFSSGLSKPRTEFGFGYQFLAFKDVFNNFFVPDELYELVNSTEKERESCSIKRGDVFLTRTSETMEDLGMSCVALKDYDSATFNGFTKRLRPKEGVDIVPEYAGYFFRSPKFRSEVTAMSSLSTRASLNNEMLGRLTMVLPTVKEQTAIGFLLKTFDDKIRVNLEISKNLEQMAQAIFKSWFIDFDPVKAKVQGKKPFGMDSETGALFPDSFEDSALGNKIPKGWKMGRISDLINIFSGYAFKSETYVKDGKYKIATIKNIQDRKFYPITKDRLQEIPNKMPNYCYLKNGDIVMSLTGNIGRVCLVVGENYLLNQRVAKLKPINQNDYAFTYIFLLQKNFFYLLQNISSGTAQQNLSPVKTKEIKMILPPRKIMDFYGSYANPLLEKINFANIENQELLALRDLLIPKLLSGEIRVNNG